MMATAVQQASVARDAGRGRQMMRGSGVLLLLLLMGCSSAPQRTAAVPADWRPLEEVARELGLDAVDAKRGPDRSLETSAGHSVYLMAGRPYFRYLGEPVEIPDQGPVLSGEELWLSPAYVQGLRDTLSGARPLATRPRMPAPPPLTPACVPASQPPTTLKILLDPGHGGRDPGAISPSGQTEKAVNLAVARRAAELLQARGHRVALSRADDRYLGLNDRVAMASREGADLFVSVHANSAANRSASGVEVFYPSTGGRRESQSKDLATRVCAAVCKETAARSRGAKRDPRGLRVLRTTTMPAVLIELGFLSNAAEDRNLSEAAYRERLAHGIADGVEAWVRQR